MGERERVSEKEESVVVKPTLSDLIQLCCYVNGMPDLFENQQLQLVLWMAVEDHPLFIRAYAEMRLAKLMNIARQQAIHVFSHVCECISKRRGEVVRKCEADREK